MFTPAVHALLLDILIVFSLFWLLISTVFVVVVAVKMRKMYKRSQHALDLVKDIAFAVGGSGVLLSTFVKVLFKRLLK